MGGAIGGGFTDVYMGPEYTDERGQAHSRIGNTTPFAEFNIWCDPDSAKSIFDMPQLQSKTTLITLDLTHRVCATKDVREMLLYSSGKKKHPTRLRQMFHELLIFFAKTYEEVFGLKNGPPLHDPLAVAVLLRTLEPSLFKDEGHQRWNVEVVTEGEQTGRTITTRSDQGVYIPKAIDITRFWQLIEESMSQADIATGNVPL